MLQGILFDMDGVIFDTERIFIKFEHKTIREMGFDITDEEQVDLCGITEELYHNRLIALMNKNYENNFDYDYFRKTSLEKIDNYYKENGVPLKSGIKDLLEYLKLNNYRIALASSGNIKRVKSNLTQSNLMQYFDFIICGEMVEKSKPDPEIFIKASKGIGLTASTCAAVEDSKNGIISASSAGCTTIMIPDVYKPDEECHKLCAAILGSLSNIPSFLEFYNNSLITPLTRGEIIPERN